MEGKHRDVPYYFLVLSREYEGVTFSVDHTHQPKGSNEVIHYLKCTDVHCNGRAQIKGDTMSVDVNTPHGCLSRSVEDRVAEMDKRKAINEMKHQARLTPAGYKASLVSYQLRVFSGR